MLNAVKILRHSFAVASMAAVCLAAIATASAQTLPKDALPPSGLTIAGPGLAGAGTTLFTVWQSNAAVNICATVLTTATSGNVTLTLRPSLLLSTRVSSPDKTFTLCAQGQTRVDVSGSGSTIFWRIDRF